MKTKTIRYLSGRTEMAKFDSLMKATFNPPRNWTLLEDLKFYSDELTEKDAEMLRHCGVQIRLCNGYGICTKRLLGVYCTL
jgi:hypothetical protein